ncbi:hypothetical protein A2U01_0038385, partial [Trifolium medium]|nr:hypothetical protein [Trifolium medium]
QSLAMPPFPEELLDANMFPDVIPEKTPAMAEPSVKTQKKSKKRKSSKKKKEGVDKTDLINPEQIPLLNAVESNQRMPEDDHLTMQMKQTADASREVPVLEE